MKICLKCSLEKEECSFSKDRNRKDGLQNWCRDCNKEYRNSRADELRDYDAKKYRKNSDAIKTRVKKRVQENPEQKRQQDWNYRNVKHPNYEKNRYRSNPDRYKKKSAEWRAKNPDKVEAHKIKNKLPEFAWHKKYPWKAKAHNARTRAAKWQRTPKWSEKKLIIEFYKNCPDGHHVDHIVPLRGKNVSGLHVLVNLQYLPASVNCSKGNKF